MRTREDALRALVEQEYPLEEEGVDKDAEPRRVTDSFAW